MYLLKTFGGLSLESDGDPLPSSALQRRRLALLVILARSSDRGISRERLMALLWPDSAAADARHALDQLLYATRRDLGKGAVLSEGVQLRLDDELVRSDCAEFAQALRRGEPHAAVERYAGPFLDGVYLGDELELERWVEDDRTALEALYREALERLARAAATSGEMDAAIAWWRRRAAAEPCSGRVAVALMEALIAGGDRAAAVQHARTHTALVRAELGLEPEPRVTELADRLAAEPDRSSDAALASSAELVGVDPGASQPTELTSATRAASRRHPVTRRAGLAAAAVAAVLVAIVAFTSRPGSALFPDSSTPRSIAVLPFEDLSGDRKAEYLGDGMSEELIHALAQLPDVRVVARTSAFAFKGEQRDVREIARALDVDAVLEGSVRRDGDRLRVTAQLIDAATGYHLWSGSFDRRMGDALGIQHQIADSIVRTVGPRLGAANSSAVRPPANAAAYHLVLRGRYSLHRGGAPELHHAVALFTQAIALDPAYALPYLGLADAYDRLADGGHAPQDSIYTLAETAVARALERDATLAEAHALRGHLAFHRWRWDEADRDFMHALELKPGDAATHAHYAIPLVMRGRFDEGISAVRRARELDPLSRAIHLRLGWLLTLSGRYEEAAAEMRTLVAMDSTLDVAHARLGLSLVLSGRHAEGVRALEVAVSKEGSFHRSALPLLGYAYARAGQRDDAEAVLQRVEAGLTDGSVNAYYAAVLAAALGQQDRAFELLEETYRVSRGCLIDLGVDPLMEPLRADPRFASLARRLGMTGT